MSFIYDFQDVSICFERMQEIHEKPNEELNEIKSGLILSSDTIQVNNLNFQYFRGFYQSICSFFFKRFFQVFPRNCPGVLILIYVVIVPDCQKQ